MRYIDYSQYRTYMDCPWKWYERYVNQVEPARPAFQRDDNLTIGSLVHAGLERWVKERKPTIPDEAIAEYNPTADCLYQCQGMINQYVANYPTEEWEFVVCEKPLTFDVGIEDWRGLAKLDKFFFVPDPTEIPTGISGETVTLARGWWSHEYKTKSAAIKRNLWAQQWETNMQAAFQLIALAAHVAEGYRSTGLAHYNQPVQGVLVQVLEKPRTYIPKRKCKGCGTMVELASYLPSTAEGEVCCPICGTSQKVSAYEPKVSHPAEFYRLVVTRTDAQLEQAQAEIEEIAAMMRRSIYNAGPIEAPNREACVDTIFGACPYFLNHTYNRPTTEDSSMVKIDALRYLGEIST